MEGEQRRNIFTKFLNLVHIRKPTIMEDSSRNMNRRYEVLPEVLGAGSFATTHLCRDRRSGTKYACKRIDKEKIKSGQLPVDYIRREINILKTLPSHRNIICLKETYENDKEVKIIFELCEGGELLEQIQTRNYIPENEATVLIKSIMQVVQWCHMHGVVHRDIKPENFLFGTNVEVFRERVLRANIDFKRTPWPQVSEGAKELLRGMLERDPAKRLTPRQILNHPWLSNDAAVTNSRVARPSEEAVFSHRIDSGR